MPALIERLIVLCGLPFSGKTTYARSLSNAMIISRDEIVEDILASPERMTLVRKRAVAITNPISCLYSDPQQNALNDAITEEYVREISEKLTKEGARVVVVDGTHLQPLSRSFVRDAPAKEKVAVVFETNPDTCIGRLQTSHVTGIRQTVTPEIIRRMAHVFERPTPEEGFDRIETR